MIYEWRCDTCGDTVEVQRKLIDMHMQPRCDIDGDQICRCADGDYDYRRILSSTSVPFEHLKDKGVFERTHWLPDTRL